MRIHCRHKNPCCSPHYCLWWTGLWAYQGNRIRCSLLSSLTKNLIYTWLDTKGNNNGISLLQHDWLHDWFSKWTEAVGSDSWSVFRFLTFSCFAPVLKYWSWSVLTTVHVCVCARSLTPTSSIAFNGVRTFWISTAFCTTTTTIAIVC